MLLRSVLPALLASISLAATPEPVSPKRYLDDVRALSSESMRGRATGSHELDKAAQFLAAEFKRAGLKPAGLNGSYFQQFPVTMEARLGSRSTLMVTVDGQKQNLALRTEWTPFNFSGLGQVQSTIVFAGYGITAPEYSYDDYAGIDVRGKVVLILRHEPREYDASSVFEGRVYTEHSQLASKVTNARQHGAAAVLFVNDMGAHSGEDVLEPFRRDVSPGDAGVPFGHVRYEIAERWLSSQGQSLKDLQAEIDRTLSPKSFSLGNVHVSIRIEVDRHSRPVSNVAAYLPGQSNEYIVFGAHYDHLGIGSQYSLAPAEVGKPHYGADDNASGTAGLLALARALAASGPHRRGFLFLAFAGEEIGLLGSSYYVSHPLLPNAQAVAMINLDMIGRIRERKVYVGGMGTGDNFRHMLTGEAAAPFDFDYSESAAYGSSDHTAFTTREIPVLFFFSGLHGDYHKPSDTWDKINAKDAARLLDYIADLGLRLSESPERTRYVRVRTPAGTGLSVAGRSVPLPQGLAGFRVEPQPSGEQLRPGLRVVEVIVDSPAAEAGLKLGDLIIEAAGRRVEDSLDWAEAWQSVAPGTEVMVRLVRNGQELVLSLRLTWLRSQNPEENSKVPGVRSNTSALFAEHNK
jgi:hypothetical protein